MTPTFAIADPVIKEIYYQKKTSLAYPATYTFRFSLWDAEVGGNEVWFEEKPLKLTSNLIKTYLGDIEPLDSVDFSLQYWVQVDRKKKDGTYVPVGVRQTLGVVPYALYSTSGVPGVEGPEGPEGPTGPQGPQGIQGPTGPQGSQGLQGAQGPQGTAGVQGSKGDTGDKGDQGDTGPTGPQGPMGPAGVGGTPSGCSILSETSTPPSGYSFTGHSMTLYGAYVGGDTWQTKADMITARGMLGAAVVNNKIYAIGGYGNGEGPGVANEEYNPATDTWTTRASMPTSRYFIGAAAVNNLIYVIGGHNGVSYLTTNQAYNPLTNTWATKASMPTPRRDFSVAAVNDKIYVFGGDNGSPLSTNEEYDPATNTWTTKADMPTPRKGTAAAVVNGKIYVFGGRDGFGSYLKTTEEYDPLTNTWTTKANFRIAREWLSTVAVNNKIYAIGGYSDVQDFPEVGGRKNTNEEYNPATDTWTTRTEMSYRYVMGAVEVNGRIYAIGGYLFNTNEEYELPSYAWEASYFVHKKD